MIVPQIIAVAASVASGCLLLPRLRNAKINELQILLPQTSFSHYHCNVIDLLNHWNIMLLWDESSGDLLAQWLPVLWTHQSGHSLDS
jgi:hypothetical protein